MEEPQDTLSKTFRITQKHINRLETINENASLALRIVLDRDERNEKRSNTKATVDDSMTWICFGLVFFIISFLMEGILLYVPLLIGVFVLMYGLMGGVMIALSRTSPRRRK